MKSPIIPDYWTAHEALAVYEFIDDIRDEIWNRYQFQLIDILQEDRYPDPIDWESYESYEGLDDEIDF